MSLPPMTRAKSGFLRMRAFCGDTEVTPIHPFVVEHRFSETEVFYEGLYVFDPAALGPPPKFFVICNAGSVCALARDDEEGEAASGVSRAFERGWGH